MKFPNFNFLSWADLKQPRLLLPSALIILFSLIAAEASFRLGWAELAEHVYSDFWHQKSGVRHQPQHVVLVVMDDKTLDMHNDDPLAFWTPHIAQGVAVLRQAGVKIVGLDILYKISPTAWLNKMSLPGNDISRTYDLPFLSEIGSGQLVMVGSKLGGQDHDEFLLPHSDYLLAIPDVNLTNGIGLANLDHDDDGIIRSFVTAQKVRESPDMAGQALPKLNLGSLLAVRSTNQDPLAKNWQLGGRTVQSSDQLLSIGYAGPPGTIPRISLGDLLQPDAGNNPKVKALKDKVVILGGEFHGMNDWHSTPYTTRLFGGGGNLMTGPEVHANIVETLLSGIENKPLPTALRLTYFLLAVGLAVLVYQRLTPWHGLLMFLAVSASAAALAYALFQQYILMPVAHLQVGLLAGYVASYGKRLTSEERSRARVTQIFGRYVSTEVVDMLLRAKKMPDLGGESLNVSILFSDIRNFTTISEKLNAHEVVEMLNTYFEKACAAVLDKGGTIDKFIGDAIMVQFGSPVRHPDHALRAVRAALVMQQAATEFQDWMAQRFAGRDLPLFQIGIGIHTGEAVIGNIGSSQRIEYTAIGDTVNIASRLEGVTKEMGCSLVISQETLDATHGQVLTGKHQRMQVKGRKQAVDVFEVIGLNNAGTQT